MRTLISPPDARAAPTGAAVAFLLLALLPPALGAQDALLQRADSVEIATLAGLDEGLSVLGARTTEVLDRGRAFRREVLAILADPDVGDPGVALAEAVARYRSRPEVALPTTPKNMDVLYDHLGALAFRTERRGLNGPLWSGHWLRLALTEPFTDLPPGPERDAALDTVTARYFAKLDRGEPPHGWPTELPLAPAIAPGLVWVGPEAAVVWDNLALLTEVLADILVSRDLDDRQAAVDAAVDFFVDATTGVTSRLAWETMALRHGIFFQGGYPVAVMTRNERNMNSHGAHMQRGGPTVIPGMVGR